MDRYCGSTFWDINKTWNTTNPDFTECFEYTSLLWSSCLFLWICVIFDIYWNGARHRSPLGIDIPTWLPGWTRLGIFKIFNITFLICLQVGVLLVNWYDHPGEDGNISIMAMPDVYWLTPLIMIVTHFLSACIIVFHKMKCIHTSGYQLIHWLFLSITHAIIFRTKYMDYLDNPEEVSPIILVGIALTVMLIQAFLLCWSDIPEPRASGHTRLIECSDGVIRQECPLLRASCLSYILFSWCSPLVRKGFKQPLTQNDLWDLIPSIKAPIVSKIYAYNYGRLKFGETRNIRRNIIKPLWKTCGWSFFLAVTCKLISCLIAFAAPMIMGFLIEFVQHPEIEQWKGYFWAVTLLVIYILMALFLEQYFLHMFKVYINIASCLNTTIYRKSLHVSHEARKEKTIGEIVNLMSIDSEKIRGLVYEADAIWSSPIQIVVGIYLIWLELGIALLPGIGVLCSIVPINWALTTISTKYQRIQMEKKDERIKVISEVLSGIQVIKLYAWEPSFQAQIQRIRAEEIRILKKRTLIQCVIQFVFDSVPFLVSIAAFFTYIYMSEGVLDPKKAFKAISLFTLLTEPITDLPSCISSAVDAVVSFRRINNFLNAEEMDPRATKREAAVTSGSAIEIIDGNFAWEDFSKSPWQLSNIDLSIRAGKLTAIVGTVASGKSSLLSAILGEMKYSGQVIVRGKIAYAPQVAWILNATLRENVCFGLPYRREKYNRVIEACGLLPDIEMLSAGDMTEIGEKGINLSGGQKQRVSLARLAYSDADILLLDDVLSAVDSHVAKHIFDNLLGPNGLLAGKTRVLCTHAYNFLSQMDYIFVLEGGKVIESGNYDRLLESGSNFSKLISSLEQTSKLDNNNGENKSVKSAPSKFQSSKEERSKKEAGKLIEEEHVETGDVKFPIYLAYIRALGLPMVFSFVIFFGLSEGLSLGRNVVLTKWTETAVNKSGVDPVQVKADRQAYAIEYTLLGVAQCLFYLFGFFILAIAALRATKLLHNNMLHRILRAPMSFFNVTLLGRIVNRFSSDIESLDKSLPSEIGDWICHIFKFLGVMIAISYGNAYFLAFIIPMFCIYYLLQRHYIRSMQQLQRMVNANKSPIYSQFQETLSGTSTVRAYTAEDRFTAGLADKIDSWNRALFPHLIVRRWLSIRLGGLGSLIVFIPAIFAVVWRDTTDPSVVGFTISYALQVTSILSWLVKVTSYLQYNFVSVERILEYSEVEQEAEFETGDGDETTIVDGNTVVRRRKLSSTWPENGNIVFRDYETRYRPGTDLVLKHFSCTINPGEKVGIVGRTGAGKSSLTLALFRIIEGVNGNIVIDGRNIAKLGLHDLRGRLTIIPQDPVIFSGNLRINLDPFRKYSDETIWHALELAHLRSFAKSLPAGLNCEVAEGGENLSVGQRQLICLARALLRKSKILVLDEATAAVDKETDDLIQETIRKEFKESTVITIAHRLNTIMDYDKVMVLDKGEIREFDTPANLMADRTSMFSGMARDAGLRD